MNEANLADIFDNNDELRPLMEFIESVMSIPDDGLTADTIESLQGMIHGAITPRMQTESVRAMLESFEDQGLTRHAAQEMVNSTKKEMNDFIDALQPSEKKRQLLQDVFNILYNVFNEAVERYHSYSIKLPMTLAQGAKEPTYAHATDAAADLYAMGDQVLHAKSLGNLINTGVRIQLPEGWAALVLPRSSIGAKTGLRLSNSVGLIDSDYRGPIGVLYDNISDSDYEIHAGDRIAQLVLMPSYRFKGEVVESLTETERGAGGFGSTGA